MSRAAGHLIRDLRVARGWSQAQLAGFLNEAAGTPTLTRNDISRWESGRRNPRYWLQHLAAVLDVDSRELATAAGHARSNPAPATSAIPSVPCPSTGGSPAEALASAMRSFRKADRQVGGGHMYATVVQYLRADVAPRLFDGDDHSTDLFTATAALTEMAGWMAHDAGRDAAARRHFARALDLASVDGDHQLRAHVLASMSHVARHLDEPAEAVSCAARGQSVLADGPSHPELESRLLAMQARATADLGDSQVAVRLLASADRALEGGPSDAPSPWVSRFDEGSLAAEAARSLLSLGDVSQARRQAERVIALRPGDRTRSRAFGQLTLASTLVDRSSFDEACTVADDAVESTRQLASYRVVQQLAELRNLLVPHQASARSVADFIPRLDEALRDRAWLYHPLQEDTP